MLRNYKVSRHAEVPEIDSMDQEKGKCRKQINVKMSLMTGSWQREAE